MDQGGLEGYVTPPLPSTDALDDAEIWVLFFCPLKHRRRRRGPVKIIEQICQVKGYGG
jgi:hypothetical protein